MNVANSVLWRMVIILKANKVNLFVSSVLFVFWYHSLNFLDTPHICDISRLRVNEGKINMSIVRSVYNMKMKPMISCNVTSKILQHWSKPAYSCVFNEVLKCCSASLGNWFATFRDLYVVSIFCETFNHRRYNTSRKNETLYF
jgi:hypothetical protein